MLQVLLFNSKFSIQHYSFVCTQLNCSKYCYVSTTLEMNISHLLHIVKWSNSHLLALNLTLLGATTPGKSGPGSEDNKGVFPISQSSSITGASPWDCIVCYPGPSLVEILPLCRDIVSVFYISSREGYNFEWNIIS